MRYALLSLTPELFHVILRDDSLKAAKYDSDVFVICTRQPVSRQQAEEYIDGAWEQILEIRQSLPGDIR